MRNSVCQIRGPGTLNNAPSKTTATSVRRASLWWQFSASVTVTSTASSVAMLSVQPAQQTKSSCPRTVKRSSVSVICATPS